MGKHNIKVTFGGGFASTSFEEKKGYTTPDIFGGGLDFNIVYNNSILDYTGDWGIGITNLSGSTEGFSDVDFIRATYINIPLELTWRGDLIYCGMHINAGIPISYYSEFRGTGGVK